MQKGSLSSGSKSLPRVPCTIRSPFCTGATPCCTGATPFSLPGLQRPFAPSPNHFWNLPFSGSLPELSDCKPNLPRELSSKSMKLQVRVARLGSALAEEEENRDMGCTNSHLHSWPAALQLPIHEGESHIHPAPKLSFSFHLSVYSPALISSKNSGVSYC